MDSESNYFDILDLKSMVTGIGRRATDEELILYISKDIDVDSVDLDEAFFKYLIQ